jgi:hypothetical protein
VLDGLIAVEGGDEVILLLIGPSGTFCEQRLGRVHDPTSYFDTTVTWEIMFTISSTGFTLEWVTVGVTRGGWAVDFEVASLLMELTLTL